MSWNDYLASFELDEDGSDSNDVGHDAEKKLKDWEDYYEYDPSSNSRDRKLSADCTDMISLKFYEDEKCFEEDGSNDVELCAFVDDGFTTS